MFTEIITSILCVVGASIITAILYLKWQYSYWSRKNFNHFPAQFPFGTTGNPLKRDKSRADEITNIYKELKARKWKYAGFYGLAKPSFIVSDLDMIKNILTKDFQYFVDRGIYFNEESDPLSVNLFNIEGAKWRNLRVKLTPTFTSGKMKMMFDTLLECEKNLQRFMIDLEKKGDPIDIKQVLGCFTTDIIGSCAFGLECNTFKDGEDSPFRRYGKKIFSMPVKRALLLSLASNFPRLGKFLGVYLNEPDVTEFFMKVIEDTIKYREENNIKRSDFLQLLIELRSDPSTHLNFHEIAAQAFLFFLAGFETSSTTSTFALYELARNQKIQDNLRSEIINVISDKYQGNITYDAIQDMKYMNQIIDETLRKYPPVPILMRVTVKDYRIPGEDGLIIEKGTKIQIPIYGIHKDPEYYPDPDKFDPDRFTDEAVAARHQYAHLPFGEGPRNCIGLRFGVMQTKVALASLLKNFKFCVNKKTQEPIKLKKSSFILAAQGGIWLDIEKI